MKMHRILPVLIASALLAACGDNKSDSSVQATPTTVSTTTPPRMMVEDAPWQLPLSLSRPATAVQGNRILALGGLTTGDVSTNAVVQIEPESGLVTKAGKLSSAVHDAGASASTERALVFAGGGASIQDTVQEWTPAGSSVVGHLPSKRADLVVLTVDQRSIVLGGTNGVTLPPDVLATNDGRNFQVLGQLAVPVRYPGALVSGTSLFLFGGETQPQEGGKVLRSDVIQRFDVATGKGEVVGRLPNPLSHSMAFVHANQFFLAGGRSDAGAQSAIWQIDASSFVPHEVGALPGPRSDAGTATIGSRTYLIGGEVKGPADALTSSVSIAWS